MVSRKGEEEIIDFAALMRKQLVDALAHIEEMRAEFRSDSGITAEQEAEEMKNAVPIEVGKALSYEHKCKMIKHRAIAPVMKKEQRLKACGTIRDFLDDPMVTYMTKYAEEIFEPKRILTSGDWLKTQHEPD